MSAKLLACPFCGKPPTVEKAHREEWITCDTEGCPAEDIYCALPDEWNRRAAISELPAQEQEGMPLEWEEFDLSAIPTPLTERCKRCGRDAIIGRVTSEREAGAKPKYEPYVLNGHIVGYDLVNAEEILTTREKPTAAQPEAQGLADKSMQTPDSASVRPTTSGHGLVSAPLSVEAHLQDAVAFLEAYLEPPVRGILECEGRRFHIDDAKAALRQAGERA